MVDHGQVKFTQMSYAKDRPKAAKPLLVQDISLRDGHQSLFATRGRTDDMLPIAEMMDQIGFWALEVWGGATFDAMHRFLNEDPWERIRTLKRTIKKTPFSMLLRAQNLVGYRNYSDDVAIAFIDRSAENGIDIFRTFDALNDYRNFETVVPAIKKNGRHFQGCICYTMTEPRMGGEVYNLDYYIQKAKEIEAMGADSICIKDMAGLLAPYDAYTLVKSLKKSVKPPIHLHSHFTSGMSPMSILKAVEAGLDIVDTCLSPYAYRTSHAALEPLVMSLLGTNRDTGFDINQLAGINEVLEKQVMPKYKHLLDDSKMSIIDINVLLHQTPGGMLSNLVNQLREMNALDKIDRVYKELPRVRKELGQIPLVTPTSQIVGTQTVNNVLFDDENERYKMITDQVKDLCYGLYGKTPVPIDPAVQQKALRGYKRGETPTNQRPAELLEPALEQAKSEIGGLAKDLDDLLLFSLYPVTGKKFLQWKYGIETPPDGVRALSLDEAKTRIEAAKKTLAGNPPEKKPKAAPKSENLRSFNVYVDQELFEVEVEETTDFSVAGPVPQAVRSNPPHIASTRPQTTSLQPKPNHAASQAVSTSEGQIVLEAPMPGMIVRFSKQVGDTVKQGEPLVILEAMKMENTLNSPASGTIREIFFDVGDAVAKDDQILLIDTQAS